MPFGGNFHPEWGALAPVPSFMRTARIVAVATAIGATAGAGVVLSLAGATGGLGPQASSEAVSDKPLVIVHSLVQPAEAAPAAPSPAVAAAPVNVPAAASAPASLATTIVTPTPVATAPSVPVVASAPAAGPTPAQISVKPESGVPALPRPAAHAAMSAPVPSDAGTASTPAVPASIAAVAEIPPATEASPKPAPDQATFLLDQTEAQKIGGRKPRGTDQARAQTAASNPQNPPKKRPEERGLGLLLRHLFSARAGSTSPN